MDFRAIGRFYEEQLQYDFLPYWFRFVDGKPLCLDCFAEREE